MSVFMTNAPVFGECGVQASHHVLDALPSDYQSQTASCAMSRRADPICNRQARQAIDMIEMQMREQFSTRRGLNQL
jgi:hypothetical protein